MVSIVDVVRHTGFSVCHDYFKNTLTTTEAFDQINYITTLEKKLLFRFQKARID